jgi:hypothetical protein
MLIRGQCHCGNISFGLQWDPDPTEIPARACTCSFCVKHGGVWTSYAPGTLRIQIAKPERVSKYCFGTKTADFHVCADCGVAPVVTCLVEERLFAVVNVNALEGIDRNLLRHTSTAFEEEDPSTRLTRRTRNWIGDVRFEQLLAGPRVEV